MFLIKFAGRSCANINLFSKRERRNLPFTPVSVLRAFGEVRRLPFIGGFMITVNKEDLVRNIRLMQDIDGYSEGDCVSRRSVLAVVNTLETYDIKALDAFVDDGK